MLSVNSINSQVNFSGSKKAPKEAKKDKPKLSELGGRTFEEKYASTKDGKPVNVTTANAGILFGDYILDHLIEFAVAGVAFVGVGLKSKKLLSGVSSGFVDAAKQMAQKDGDKIGAAKKFVNYMESAKKNIAKAKKAKATNIADNLQEAAKENARKTIVEGSVIDKIVKKADDDKSVISKIVKKVTKNPNAGSKEAAEFFAKDLGITRGADVIDNAMALGTAGAAAKVAKDGADIGTDLNDDDVADKAAAANRRSIEKAQKAASVVLNAL